MKKPTKTPRPTHRQETSRQAETTRHPATPATPRHGIIHRPRNRHHLPAHRPEYRDESYGTGTGGKQQRTAQRHATTGRETNGKPQKQGKAAHEVSENDEKTIRDGHGKTIKTAPAREEESANPTETSEASKKTIKTETSREQGNRRRRPGGDNGMTIRACNSRFNR